MLREQLVVPGKEPEWLDECRRSLYGRERD